ncbi:MAG TPA: prepilin-type N-terminal cleavage/methylation domain-containing protein [Methylomirabilota bacterium]|jgi:prepilin-type N-terminal cleavage/methylation domain-containing protein|nr:prepilin-type N-terminal cleavage/methylation domain-containing protein [Methylomirabilota bacterium]
MSDRRGFSLPELLVSCGVLGLVMAGVAGVLSTGGQVSVEGDNRAQAQQTARAAMIVEEELRLAGYGFPTAQPKILAASPTGITFWADLTNASTRITANANAGDTLLNVASGAGFTAGDVIYLMNTDQFWTVTVSSASATTILIPTPGIPVALPQGVQVGRPKQIRYQWDGISTLFKDTSTGLGFQPLATGVTGFQLTYFDTNDVAIPVASLAASLGIIRRVVITLTAQSAGTDEVRSFTLTSSVRPRNL